MCDTLSFRWTIYVSSRIFVNRQTMGKMFIINAPTIFTIIWSFVKRVVDPRTVAKIDVVGSNYLPKLLMYVDAENLPVQFGGLDTTPWPGVEPGPWDVYRSNNIRHLFTDESDLDDRVMPKKYSVAAADQESPISYGDAAAPAAPAFDPARHARTRAGTAA